MNAYPCVLGFIESRCAKTIPLLFFLVMVMKLTIEDDWQKQLVDEKGGRNSATLLIRAQNERLIVSISWSAPSILTRQGSVRSPHPWKT